MPDAAAVAAQVRADYASGITSLAALARKHNLPAVLVWRILQNTIVAELSALIAQEERPK